MDINFDIFNRQEIPPITLCNITGEELGSLDNCLDIDMTLNFNTLSELSLRIPSTNPYYNYVTMLRIIKVEGFGQFTIIKCPEKNNGIERYKQVQAYSLERELVSKNTGQIKGTLKFYDSNPTNRPNTLLGLIESRLGGLWTIGEVDIELENVYRTFDIIDLSIYNFLMTDVEQTYECIFTFDTELRKINAYKPSNVIKDSSIFMSFENLIKEIEIEPQEEQLCTALEVLGGGDLDIRQVNPLGTNYLYDFSYFVTKNYMTPELVQAIALWEAKLESQKIPYRQKLLELKQLQQDLISLNTQLVEYESDKKALLQQQGVAVDAQDSAEVSRLNGLIQQKQNQISTQVGLINDKKTQIQSKRNELKAINQDVSFENNFTPALLLDLRKYIKEQSFQEPNIIKTPEMTDVQIMDNALNLMELGENTLSKLSKPRYTFTMEAVNFLSNKEYISFISQLQVGTKITLDIENAFDLAIAVKKRIEDYFPILLQNMFNTSLEELFFEKQSLAAPIVLQIAFSFTDPSKLSITFGDRLRLQNEDMDFEELMGQTVNTTTSVNGNSALWGDWVRSGAQQNVTNFVNSALDASKNELISSQNQQITFGGYGLQGKQVDPNTGQFLPTQCWLTSNQLCFTEDGWNTVKVALGKIRKPDGNWGFGLATDVFIGNIIFGNQLAITNENGSMVFDAGGFTSTSLNQLSRVLINPNDGFRIQGRANTTNAWVNKIYMGNDGNANFSGNIDGSIITGSSFYAKSGDTEVSITPGTPFSISRGNDTYLSIYADDSSGSFISMSNPRAGDGRARIQVVNTGTNNKNQLVVNSEFCDTSFYSTEGFEIGADTVRINASLGIDVNPGSNELFVSGDARVTGSKNAIVPTQHYGSRLLYCEESDKVYFNTKGIVDLSNGEAIINLDPIFMETIELNNQCPYIINLTPYGDAKVWVEKVENDKFIIKGDKDIKVAYVLSATRISYANVYLEESKKLSNKELDKIQEIAIERMR